MSRPRKVSDQTLLQSAYDIIMDHGLSKLTFSRLGQTVGLVPAAIAKRFTTKQNLLAEVDRYALTRSITAFQLDDTQYDSPIDALIAGMTAELSFASSLHRFVHGQSFLLHVLGDNTLKQNYQQSFDARRLQLTRLLHEAQDKHFITKDISPQELAVLLQTVQHGIGHVWAMSSRAPIQTQVEGSIRLALQPYIINKS